jgi:hypothetical protein
VEAAERPHLAPVTETETETETKIIGNLMFEGGISTGSMKIVGGGRGLKKVDLE